MNAYFVFALIPSSAIPTLHSLEKLDLPTLSGFANNSDKSPLIYLVFPMFSINFSILKSFLAAGSFPKYF